MKKQSWRSLLGLFAILYGVSGVLVAAVFYPAQTSAATWLDPGWQYRRAIVVTNASTQTLTNHQVNVSLNATTFNFSHSSGNDIRFTDTDGTTLLNHWTENYSAASQTASFVVRVPQVAASASKTIYLYYGNAGAAGASSGSKTFTVYDGFERLRNAVAPLTTPTYDGSGQTVHPDVVHFPNGWNGFKYWMATTPYPGGNDQVENPSILASNDGLSWSVPAGAINPLVPAPPCDHNNDADMIYNADTNELWMYYLDTRRASRCAGHENQPYYNHNFMKLIKSSNGVNWSSPATVIDWPLSTQPLYLSPSVVKVGQTFYLWLTNGSTSTTISQSSNGTSFGPSQAVNIASQIWHLDVEYIPSKNEYWMLSNYPSLPNGVIRFARSTDRVNWTTYTNPALSPTASGWDKGLYRATFLYDPHTNLIRMWYSAHNGTSVWRTGHTSVDYNDLLNQVNPNGLWTKEAGTGTWTVATEQKKRGASSGKLVQTGATQGTSMRLTKPQPLANNFYQEVDIYDDLDATAFKTVRSSNSAGASVGVGVWTGASASKYVFHNKAYGYTVTSVPRAAGWHKFGILLKADSSVTFFIDGQNVGTIAGQFANADRVQVEGYWGGTTTYYVDDIRVRKSVSPEPSATVGAEETQ